MIVGIATCSHCVLASQQLHRKYHIEQQQQRYGQN